MDILSHQYRLDGGIVYGVGLLRDGITDISARQIFLVAFAPVRVCEAPTTKRLMVMASNQEMSDLWAPILICLFLKWFILRHVGIRSYRRAVSFFLGLVLGDYLLGSIWSILSVVLNMNMYQFYP